MDHLRKSKAPTQLVKKGPRALGTLSAGIALSIGSASNVTHGPMGVQPFDLGSYDWTSRPPLLNAATSVAVSPDRNLVVQTENSIQVFSTGVLMSGEVRDNTLVSHVFPLAENHIICVLQPIRHIAVPELETLRELRRDDEISPC